MKFLASLVILFNISNINANELSCSGTEPFWNADVNSNSVTFNLVGDDSVKVSNIKSITNAAGMSDGYAFVIEADKNISLSILKGECNDGMSDNIYPFHVILKDSKNVFYGCCNLKK
jgi:uncharacterized membrane protein